MTWRTTHLLYPENIRTVKRTLEKNSREHWKRTVENTVRTSKLSPLETRRERE